MFTSDVVTEKATAILALLKHPGGTPLGLNQTPGLLSLSQKLEEAWKVYRPILTVE